MLQLRGVQELSTAADVIANARLVQARRRAMKAAPLPTPEPPKLAALDLPPAPPPEPKLIPEPPIAVMEPAPVDPEPETPPLYGFQVRDAVARFYKLTNAEIEGHSRRQIYARPRLIAYYLMMRLSGTSSPKVGRLMGRRDHSTIIVGVQKIEALIASGDTAVLSDIAELTKIIEAGS